MADGRHPNAGVCVFERFFKSSALPAVEAHGNEGELEDEPIEEIWEALGS